MKVARLLREKWAECLGATLQTNHSPFVCGTPLAEREGYFFRSSASRTPMYGRWRKSLL